VALRTNQFFDFLAVRLNGEKAASLRFAINWRFPDTGEAFVLNLENAALTHRTGESAQAAATITMARTVLDKVITRATTFPEAIAAGTVRIDGDRAVLGQLLGCLDEFQRMFNLAEPRGG
jgi:alkyl sulfatase BDS1-like metallo-beta-lactamase superfamily hydrolase